MSRTVKRLLICAAALVLLGVAAFVATQEWEFYQAGRQRAQAGAFCAATPPGSGAAAIVARARLDPDQTSYAVYLDGVVVEYGGGCACRIPLVQGQSGTPQVVRTPAP